MNKLYLFLHVFFFIFLYVNASELTVEIQAGKVRGRKDIGLDGIEFFSFKGIPYAKPPIGELRFKDPEPLEPWTGVRDATNFGSFCAQKHASVVGSENCLYLNVYTRRVTPNQRWPVMVWIHGGNYVYGSGDDTVYGPDFFMSKDVVLVTINYRLGVLGFLNLDDEVAPGNQGLKDQVIALKWVRDNIENFGGDPDNVTIFGESAGGSSVHYLTISPLAEGLFHKAITQSGVVLNPWAYNSVESLKERTYKLCEELGHAGKDAESIVEFLRKVDATTLIETQEKTVPKKSIAPYGPSTDSKSKHAFMPVHPEVAYVKGTKVPMIIGYNSRECIGYLMAIMKETTSLPEFFNESDNVLQPSESDTIKRLYNLTIEELKHIYFNGKPATNESLDNMADFLSDVHFVEGIQRVIKNQINKNYASTYFYQFTFDKETSIFRSNSTVYIDGASHSDELEYLFRMHFFDGKMKLPMEGPVKHKISQQMIELWVNFATTGTPTPKLSELLPVNWEPVSQETGLRYLNIGEDLRIGNAADIEKHYKERKYPKNVE